MKPFSSSNNFLSLQKFLRSRVSDLVTGSFCTEAPLRPDSLFSRVAPLVDRSVSVVPILDQWIEEGKSVDKPTLQALVKRLKGFKRYVHALEINTWMSDRRYLPLSPGDLADRLVLIYKVRGLEHVENYFSSIPKQRKVYQTYGALLNCYAEERSVEKAEALFEEMKKLKMLTSFSYNVLIRLYSDVGQHEKVDLVLQGMKESDVRPDIFTDDVLLTAYANSLNIEKMEKVLEKLEHLNHVNCHKYAITVRAYLKAGLKDKALEALKKSEKLVPAKGGRVGWGFLLTLYADIGNRDEMYRLWNAYKSSTEKAANSMYLTMISGLLKLDDVAGAEALFEEWKSHFSYYDFRISHILISAYCKRGLLSKAESLVTEAIQSGGKPFANTWAQLAAGYFEVNEIPKAVEMMKKAVEAGKTWWKPSADNVRSCLEYFGGQKDAEAAEEFIRVCRQLLVPLTGDVYDCLLKTCMAAGRQVSSVIGWMKEDGFSVDEEMKESRDDQLES